MHIHFSKKEWDTVFFGYEIAEVKHPSVTLEEYSTLINLAQKEEIKLLYLVLQKEHRFLEDNGCRLADIKINFLSKVLQVAPIDSNILVYPKGTDYLPLLQLALDSGVYSRFKTDPTFNNNEFEKLYTEWIKKSVSGLIADVIFVYKLDNNIVGMVTVRLHQKEAHIGLIAVQGGHRGRLIGKKLIDAVHYFSGQNQCTHVMVPTQKQNEGACNFYLKNGFQPYSTDFIYHLWLNKLK